MKALKIATFNINGIRSRLPALLAWLEREQPDIACLQELKAADQPAPGHRSGRLWLPVSGATLLEWRGDPGAR